MTRDQQRKFWAALGDIAEQWRDIAGFEGRYQVSNCGRVRSLDRTVPRPGSPKGGTQRRRGLLMKAPLAGNGYPMVSLGRKLRHVHALVAEAFCSGRASGLVVNHKNGDPTDNRAENLEWVTQGQNIAHAFRALGRKPTLKGRTGESHPTARPVVAIHQDGRRERFGCGLDAVRAGAAKSSGAVSRCCRGEYATHAGLRWEYE